MHRGIHALTFCAAIALTAVASPVCSQNVDEKQRADRTLWIPKGDPDMAAAMQRARSTLAEFLALADAPLPSTSLFTVKVGIPAKGTMEYFWIIPFTHRNGRFSGKIDNTPELADSVRLGDTITFDQDQIVDWGYLENGRIKGNYTLCVLLKREPREESEAFIARSGMDCRL
jgi:uncharacterized protein YegJ (DUF2314 family)